MGNPVAQERGKIATKGLSGTGSPLQGLFSLGNGVPRALPWAGIGQAVGLRTRAAREALACERVHQGRRWRVIIRGVTVISEVYVQRCHPSTNGAIYAGKTGHYEKSSWIHGRARGAWVCSSSHGASSVLPRLGKLWHSCSRGLHATLPQRGNRCQPGQRPGSGKGETVSPERAIQAEFLMNRKRLQSGLPGSPSKVPCSSNFSSSWEDILILSIILANTVLHQHAAGGGGFSITDPDFS